MNKQQVKVMVGQTRSRNEDGHLVEITHTALNGYAWKSTTTDLTGTAFDNTIHTRFTFVPANDLEWLAVNERAWDGTDEYPVIYRDDDSVDYCKLDAEFKSYTQGRWHDMRVHLGLETNEITTEEIDMLTKPNKATHYSKKLDLYLHKIAHSNNTSLDRFFLMCKDGDEVFLCKRGDADKFGIEVIDDRSDEEKLVDDICLSLGRKRKEPGYNGHALNLIEDFNITRK